MDLHKGYYSFFPNETWTPSVNLYETEGAYLVCVDLAGVDKQKIDIEVVEQRLTLRGHRTVPVQPDPEELPAEKAVQSGKSASHAPARTATANATVSRPKVHLMEIDHGSFGRVVELPCDVHKDAIGARYVNGMLWIELPKK